MRNPTKRPSANSATPHDDRPAGIPEHAPTLRRGGVPHKDPNSRRARRPNVTDRGEPADAAEVPREPARGLLHGSDDVLARPPIGKEALDGPDDADRSDRMAVVIEDRRGDLGLADHGLLVLDGVRPRCGSTRAPAGASVRLDDRSAGQPRERAVEQLAERRLVAVRRDRLAERATRATGSRPRPRGSARSCPAGTRGGRSGCSTGSAHPRERPPRSGSPASPPTAATARAARDRPGTRCRAAAAPVPAGTCPSPRLVRRARPPRARG